MKKRSWSWTVAVVGLAGCGPSGGARPATETASAPAPAPPAPTVTYRRAPMAELRQTLMGHTEADVIQLLGRPDAVRDYGDQRYLTYRCGAAGENGRDWQVTDESVAGFYRGPMQVVLSEPGDAVAEVTF